MSWFLVMHMGESSNLTVILTPSSVAAQRPCSVKTPSSLNKRRFPQNTGEELINENRHGTAKTPCATSLILTNKFFPRLLGMNKWHPQNQEHHTQEQKQEQNLENKEPNLQPQLPLLKETSPSNLPRSKQHRPKRNQ